MGRSSGVNTHGTRTRQGRGGHIVNTASIAGLSPPYDASKHAVVAMSEGLFTSLRAAEMPVGVSCLCPGWVKTGIAESERNGPAEFGDVPERDAGAEISRNYVQRAIDEGVSPAAVADHHCCDVVQLLVGHLRPLLLRSGEGCEFLGLGR